MKLRNCSMKEFLKRLGDDMLVCFGAGVAFIDMLKFHEDDNICEKVKFLVDNNKKIWNATTRYKNNIYNIFSPEELLKYKSKKLNILITSAWFLEIIDQLDPMELNNADVYVFPIMQAFNEESVAYPTKLDIQRIPKKIHYCWFGGNPLSEQAKDCIESWKKHCPDYEIVEWNETNYDVNKIRYTKEAYEYKKYAFVSDYARLDIINQHGGIYMDTDVMVVKNLDPLLYNEAYCGFLNHAPRINTGCGFGAVKGFHILQEWMDAYKYELFATDSGFTTGKYCSAFQTDVLKFKDFKQNGKLQVVEGLVCYPREYFEPLSYLTGLDSSTENTYSIHFGILSWNDNTSHSLKSVRSKTNLEVAKILKRMHETEEREKSNEADKM